jgi:hypothetical protein
VINFDSLLLQIGAVPYLLKINQAKNDIFNCEHKNRCGQIARMTLSAREPFYDNTETRKYNKVRNAKNN